MFNVTATLDLIKAYQPYGADDAAYQNQFTAFLNNLDHLNGQSPEGILCGSGWVIDPIEQKILLLWNAKMGRWLNPGGKYETADQTIQRTTTREVFQEVGISADPDTLQLIDIDVITPDENPGFVKKPIYDMRFLITGSSLAPLSGELEKTPAWYGFDKATELLGHPVRNKRMLDYTAKLFKSL